MMTLHCFKICYRLHGQVHQFFQRDSDMTDADAWYYVTLHSGTGLGINVTGECANRLQHHAMAQGVSDVTWVKLP